MAYSLSDYGAAIGGFIPRADRFLRLIAVFLTAYPTVAIALGGTIALVVIIALRERWHGRPF
jgi:hypothetical protein